MLLNLTNNDPQQSAKVKRKFKSEQVFSDDLISQVSSHFTQLFKPTKQLLPNDQFCWYTPSYPNNKIC